MADVQKYFELFHNEIRTDYDINKTLREKKDIVVDLVQRYLREKGHPQCNVLLQGSYRVGTGICALPGLEFDIDVGLRFGFEDTKYSPAQVRGWVLAAVDGHTKSVEAKGPCIRVNYQENYHVDLVCYANWTDSNQNRQFRLAHKSKGWRPADPLLLLEYVDKAREGFVNTVDSATKTDQLRRVVRYLKRWNDEAIPHEAKHKPTGLALLLLAINTLAANTRWDGTPDDRAALEQLVGTICAIVGRISFKKPAPEYEDVFERISDEEMNKLKERFAKLRDALVVARQEIDPVRACTALRNVFGRDFPVPDPRETAKKSSGPAIVTSSASA